MRKKLIISSIILLTLFTFVACELFLEKPPKPTIYALLVGIDYKNTNEQRDLPGTVGDAKELAAALYHRGAEMGNSVEIRLMLQENNSPLPANQDDALELYPTVKNIITQINKIANLVTENDIFVFYFAGHGSGDEDNLGTFATASLGTYGAGDLPLLTTKTLREEMQTVKGTKILILDSCYSGAHEVDYPRSFAAQSTDSAYDPAQFYLLASSAHEKSWETNEFSSDHAHGYLTALLLKSLGWQHDGTSTIPIFNSDSSAESESETNGHIPKGSTAPVERNGSIMMGDIFSYISNKFRNNKGQTPQTGSGPLDLVLFSRHW